MEAIKLLLVDDQPLFIEGLSLILPPGAGLEIVGTASNGLEAFELIGKTEPDVLITDIQMPEMDGIELTKLVREHYPKLPVIGLTMFGEDRLILEMLESGARGYLMKTILKDDLVDAVRAVYNGGYYFCNQSSKKLSKLIAQSKVEPFLTNADEKLNETEIKIIQLICAERSSKEISEELNLGLRTIESYRHRIFEKTGTKNMAGLAVYAYRYGIYRP